MRADSVPHIFVIAEAGVNHNGSVEMGERLIDAAMDAGADAVKFQSFRADSLVSRSAPRAAYQVRNQPGEDSQLDMLRKLELSEGTQLRLCEYARNCGIEFMSTPFDLESLEFLVKVLKISRLKIASGEMTNARLLLSAARSGLPLILSTGMCTLDDIDAALGVVAFGCSNAGEPAGAADFNRARPAMQAEISRRVSLLHCTSDYPVPIEHMNLRAMETLRARYGMPVGLSDHSVGTSASIAAAALGACIIEKHFTLDRNLPGPDHRASLEPGDLRSMIGAIRDVCAALGTSDKAPTAPELETRNVARRSLVASRRIRKGEHFTSANIEAKRPGTGVSPMYYWDWIGKTAERDYEEDDPL